MDAAVKDGARTPWRDWLAMLGRRRRPRPRLSKVECALIGANGKALTMLVTSLQARGHLDVREFADLLGIFSAVWAGLLKDSVSS